MKKILAALILSSLSLGSVFAATGDTADEQNAVLQSLTKLIQSYEIRLVRLQDEVNRLRIENAELQTKLGTGAVIPAPAPIVEAVTTTAAGEKTDQEKKFDAIASNITSDLATILQKNYISATGSVGLFEFIEPDAFFISIDDGLNPPGVTAFKTKILFKYNKDLILTVTGVFDLDYKSQRYVTLRGSNPYAGISRIRIKNPLYKGKLLDDVLPTNSTLSATLAPKTPSDSIVPVSTVTVDATIANIRMAYEKNKLGDTIKLATTFLEKNPGNIEVLTMRARSYYIFGKFNEAIADINAIYAIQKDAIDCGIVNDGARAEKALKGANGTTFTALQTSKCKKK